MLRETSLYHCYEELSDISSSFSQRLGHHFCRSGNYGVSSHHTVGITGQ